MWRADLNVTGDEAGRELFFIVQAHTALFTVKRLKTKSIEFQDFFFLFFKFFEVNCKKPENIHSFSLWVIVSYWIGEKLAEKKKKSYWKYSAWEVHTIWKIQTTCNMVPVEKKEKFEIFKMFQLLLQYRTFSFECEHNFSVTQKKNLLNHKSDKSERNRGKKNCSFFAERF